MVSKRRKDDDFTEWENLGDSMDWKKRDDWEEVKSYRYNITEPMLDVRECDRKVKIIIEASGSGKDDVVIEKISPHSVEISLKYRGRKVRKHIVLPTKVKSEGYTVKVRNGVAQILLSKE